MSGVNTPLIFNYEAMNSIGLVIDHKISPQVIHKYLTTVMNKIGVDLKKSYISFVEPSLEYVEKYGVTEKIDLIKYYHTIGKHRFNFLKDTCTLEVCYQDWIQWCANHKQDFILVGMITDSTSSLTKNIINKFINRDFTVAMISLSNDDLELSESNEIDYYEPIIYNLCDGTERK